MGFAHMQNGIELQGSTDKPIEASIHSSNNDFVPFYNMEIIAGRNLLPSDSVKEFLINQTAAKALGFNNPKQAIGRLLSFDGQNKAYPIAGVVADFYENSFHQQIMPVVIANDPASQVGIALKLTTAEFQQADITPLINKIAKEWKEVYPEEPFDYSFLGDSIARLYENDQKTQWLMRAATVVTILISCMGLFGLAMFNTERRRKEIGIRKVLGANVLNLTNLLAKEFILLVLIAFTIAAPLAYYFIDKWLQSFAYRTSASLWVFVLSVVFVLMLTCIAVGFQTIKAAVANPVKSLRTE
jgi:ABC-type antimicrobial peptide transport system permease subunit